MTPDGKYAIVTVEGVGREPDSVDVFEIATPRRVASVDVGKQAGGRPRQQPRINDWTRPLLATGERLLGNGGLWRFFFEHSPDGAFGDLPTGPGERLRDLLAASETGRVHGMDEMADDIGMTPDGRVGADERAHCFFSGICRYFLLPPSHSICRDRKELGRFLLGKSKERLEFEDLESQLGGVMRPPPLWDLLPSLGLDSADRFVTPGHQSEPSYVGKGDLKGFAGVSVLGELGSTSKAEKSGGFDQSAQAIWVEIGLGGGQRD